MMTEVHVIVYRLFSIALYFCVYMKYAKYLYKFVTCLASRRRAACTLLGFNLRVDVICAQTETVVVFWLSPGDKCELL